MIMGNIEDVDPMKFKAAVADQLRRTGKFPRPVLRKMMRMPAYALLVAIIDCLRLPHLDLEIDGKLIRFVEIKGSC